jgi:hypothetical protein
MSLDIDLAVPARLCLERDGRGAGAGWAGASKMLSKHLKQYDSLCRHLESDHLTFSS